MVTGRWDQQGAEPPEGRGLEGGLKDEIIQAGAAGRAEASVTSSWETLRSQTN